MMRSMNICINRLLEQSRRSWWQHGHNGNSVSWFFLQSIVYFFYLLFIAPIFRSNKIYNQVVFVFPIEE